ncbi:MAG TPA: PocR ligand-binding domain-containing protein [Terracidiphilus sp.]|jgi:AraC-like DNA-binding protein/ligand-binding sensor protein
MKKHKADLSETLKQEFKKDLELFEYFLVLLNDSSPIRNVELMWADDLELFDPSQAPRVNTGDALVQLQPANEVAPERTSPSPSTHFCDLVHGFGAHEETTCAHSDKPAKERCRATGKSQVYPCHVGLTDIAVPVVCEGRYLGTLFSGQVLAVPPTAEGFAQVKETLQGQPHIDMARLEDAYYRVPVVTTAQLAEMLRMLEVFARYLANAWKRLEIMSEFQRMRERELALDRRELAEMLLSGQAGNVESVRALARNVGLERYPDRVLVMRLQGAMDETRDSLTTFAPSRGEELGMPKEIGGNLALARAAHMIEDRCQSWPNTLATVVTPGEMCIFTAQKSRTPGNERMLLEEMAHTLLRIARAQGFPLARVGISSLHQQSAELLRAYHEAASALESGHSPVNCFEALPEPEKQPAQALGRLLRALQLADSTAITGALREFLASAAPAAGTVAELQQARGLLTWACEHLARELGTMGISAAVTNAAKERAVQIIVGSPSSFAMAEAFRGYVDSLRQQLVQMFSQREEKIVSETHRLVRDLGPEKVTIQDLARDLKLSAGHLGRVYSRTTGHTLEEYLIRQRLEMGKRLLLDPRLHVAEVADRCGFCNPAYFASVFKKYMHCTPRAYASQPQRWGSVEAMPELERVG